MSIADYFHLAKFVEMSNSFCLAHDSLPVEDIKQLSQDSPETVLSFLEPTWITFHHPF